ncbi:hypothetical protein BN2475_150133 [Paraburkholderia ribeironis]|uniref:Uncharacterized protein n=1 Tax=Paraburkholderia ribeironis TaxID=1247936 RepID=A0A1N7RTS4_9BURK|nr:hypothetical protein BN2475_150133 [Paraburkholderia ribeironis]
MCSRLKIWVKLFMTVVVPAPLEPVTAMIGCLTDMRVSPDNYVLVSFATGRLPGPSAARQAEKSGRNSERGLKSGDV